MSSRSNLSFGVRRLDAALDFERELKFAIESGVKPPHSKGEKGDV